MKFWINRGIRMRWGLLAFALLISIGTSAIFVNRSFAQQAAQGLQVSPPIVDLNSEKGGSYNIKITVTNVTTESLTLTSTVNDFKSGDESGNPQILDDNEASPTYSVKSWVKAAPSFVLKPKESRTVTFTVNIPSNAEAGGHYGVIRFNPKSETTGNENLSLTASVGVLLLTRVEGNIKEDLSIKDLFIKHNDKTTGFVANGPVNIAARLENTGNVHVKPVGKLTIKNMFGRVVQTSDFGSNTKNVLPGSTRLYEQEFDKRWLFGRYTASVEASYGSTGGVVLASTSFWVIPYKLIAFLIVIIVLLVLVLRRSIKRYNKRVIRRSRNSR